MITAFIANDVNEDGGNQVQMGKSSILLGNNPTSYAVTNAKVTDDFFDTGFFRVDESVKGQTVTIRREGGNSDPAKGDRYHISAMRLYQTPNLLMEYLG